MSQQPTHQPSVGEVVPGVGGKWVGTAGGSGGTPAAKSGILGDIWDIQQGTFDPQKSPQYGSQFNLQRQKLDQGYRGAADNILARTKPGGGQTAALAEMYRSRGEAQAAGDWGLESSIINDLTNLGRSGATGVPFTAAGGMSNIGQLQSQMATSQSNNDKSALSNAFSGAATGVGYYYGGPAGGTAANSASQGKGRA